MLQEKFTSKPIRKKDFGEFKRRLKCETELLRQWFEEGAFTENYSEGGAELELFLLNRHLKPEHHANLDFLSALEHEAVVPEVASSALEINTGHWRFGADFLTHLERNITDITKSCRKQADVLGLELLRIGTVPAGWRRDVAPDKLTAMQRYHVMEQVVFDLASDEFIPIDISGQDRLRMRIKSMAVMGCTAAYQLHMRVGFSESVRFYNLAQILAGPLVAVCSNSPYLFGRELWEETRIALFEGVMSTLNAGPKYQAPRVTFGDRYVKQSIFELYDANQKKYPVILPQLCDHDAECMSHVSLHNGTIYRWNRPVLGVEKSKRPHLRIEFRPLSAGPTTVDMIANTALFFGCMKALFCRVDDAEHFLPFEHAKNNFYNAARRGMSSKMHWTNEQQMSPVQLVHDVLLPLAEEGLSALKISDKDSKRYLGVIEKRMDAEMTGSRWQRQFIEKGKNDFVKMMARYLELQNSNIPVHEWPL